MQNVQVNGETERMVINAILAKNEAYYGVRLTKEHFIDTLNRAVFGHIAAMMDAGLSVDSMTLSEHAPELGAGKISAFEPTSAANIEYYAGQLRERKRCADIMVLLKDALSLADAEESSEVIDFATTGLLRINTDKQNGLQRISELTHDTVDRLEESYKRGGALPGVSSGYGHIDQMTGGFRNSEMCVIAARTSIGKTAFALNLAANMTRAGRKVAFFSCEMSNEEIMDRLISGRTRIPHSQIRKAIFAPSDFVHLTNAIGEIHNEPMWLCDTPNIKFDDLRNQARMFCSQGGEIVFVDYLTLIKYGDAHMPRHERVGMLSVELKSLARELRVPVIVLSQLNRTSEGNKPTLETIRQSGEIEENADMIMLLHRERDDNPSDTELNIAKHRNGPTGTVKMRFDLNTLRFYGVERSEE